MTGSRRPPSSGRRLPRDLLLIGWIEYVDLPEFGLKRIRAKIDTGARTSALHAADVREYERDGEPWVRFRAATEEDDTGGVWVDCPIHDRREIKNTGGEPETRVIVRTRFRIARRSWTIEVSLADRSNMKFPLIVGRTALKNHAIAVHPRRAHLAHPGTRKKKERSPS